MKKIIMFVMALCFVILFGCSKSTTSTITPDNTNTVSDNDFFQRNQECLSYKEQIEKDLLDNQKKLNRWKYSLEQIFYSPVKKACFFVSIVETYYWAPYGNTEKWLYKYWNHSVYSESEFNCNYYYDENKNLQDNKCYELDNEVKKLKWE